ncbi:MAG: hypothetical protein HC800_23670 [Phormidesmis sp. RL_2_1]|nr:hypothetical protein [Phormidesmis sp. RL_2_1]
MFEVVDNFVTSAMTWMIYAGPICMGVAFFHFVVTHPMPERSEPTAIPETTRSRTATEKLDEAGAQVADSSAQIEKIPTAPQSNHPEIVCEPIDWKLWKVKELRETALRNIFNIKVRKDGRASRKRDLISQYEKAMKCMEESRLRALPKSKTIFSRC